MICAGGGGVLVIINFGQMSRVKNSNDHVIK